MFATTPNFRVKKQINNNVTLQCRCVKIGLVCVTSLRVICQTGASRHEVDVDCPNIEMRSSRQ